MLEWKVIIGNFNSGEIEQYNVFRHYGFMQDLIKIKKKYGGDREKFTDEVRTSLRYFYWAKCEWEVIVSHWPGNSERFHDKKIDVYDQVAMNFDRFMDYLWEHKSEIGKKVKEDAG